MEVRYWQWIFQSMASQYFSCNSDTLALLVNQSQNASLHLPDILSADFSLIGFFSKSASAYLFATLLMALYSPFLYQQYSILPCRLSCIIMHKKILEGALQR